MTEKKNVLITGGAGLIGGILIDRLSAVYNFTSLDRVQANNAPSVITDLSDLEAVTAAFEGQDAVVHLAADRRPSGSWDSILNNNFIAL